MRPEVELVRHWLERAQVDLRSAQVDLSVEPPITEDACFHCQQVAEKTLKAFLVHHGVEFEHTHQIERLIQQCADINPVFVELHETADRLTSYAVRFRYPYPGPSPSREQAEAALAVARQVWDFAASRLPGEVVP
jgi:HEPN domain-containing protein